MAVPARVSLITLGVVDLNRSTDFYRALGWPLSSASVFGTVSFFRTGGAVALAINLDTPEDVDAALQQAVAAGGHLIRSANTADWGGYSGYFADPDGHLWEVAYNPFWPIGLDGRPILP